MKEKPTVEQFISMNRGINNGGDLPRELLEVSVPLSNKISIDSLINEMLLLGMSEIGYPSLKLP